MRGSPAALERLTEQFARLPGVGMKSAQLLAFHVLEMPLEGAEAFAEAIVDARRSIHPCPVCQNLTDQETCPICADPKRDHSVLCVVAEPKDVIAMERAREAGYEAVRFLVGARNLPAQRSYAPLGFDICGETDQWDEHWLCYEKRLA